MHTLLITFRKNKAIRVMRCQVATSEILNGNLLHRVPANSKFISFVFDN